MIIGFFIGMFYETIYWATVCSSMFVIGMLTGIVSTVCSDDDAYYNGTMDTHPQLWFNMMMTHLGVAMMASSGLVCIVWFIVYAIQNDI